MKSNRMRLRYVILFVCLMVLPLPPHGSVSIAAEPTTGAAKEPGDLWETTTEMQMMGMSMPARTSRHCAPREWKEPPGAGDNDRMGCETTGFTGSGPTYNWKMKCAGPPPMTGEGQITRTADGYSGTMKMQTPQGEVTMKMTGKRLGDCDGGETKRQMAKIQGTAATAEASAMKSLCDTAVTSMQLSMLTGPTQMCKDPGAKDRYCARLATAEGFDMVRARDASNPGGGIEAATSFCGTSAETIQAGLCADAEKREDLDYLGSKCPDAAGKIAAKECAGRTYSSLMGTKYMGFCSQYAREMLSSGATKTKKP
jgi:hypothetical protein